MNNGKTRACMATQWFYGFVFQGATALFDNENNRRCTLIASLDPCEKAKSFHRTHIPFGSRCAVLAGLPNWHTLAWRISDTLVPSLMESPWAGSCGAIEAVPISGSNMQMSRTVSMRPPTWLNYGKGPRP